MKYNKCKLPHCPRNANITSPYSLCAQHTDLAETIIWVLNNVKKTPKSPLVLPGSKEFKKIVGTSR